MPECVCTFVGGNDPLLFSVKAVPRGLRISHLQQALLMTTKTTPSDLKTLPEGDHLDSQGQHGVAPPISQKPKKRGLIWVVFLLIIAGIAGYAVWRAGHPVAPVRGQGGGGGGRG